MSKQKLSGIAAGPVSHIKDSWDEDEISSGFSVLLINCSHHQFPSENKAPGGLAFYPGLFLSLCIWPHHINSLQEADANSPSLLISKAAPLLGLPIGLSFFLGSWWYLAVNDHTSPGSG